MEEGGQQRLEVKVGHAVEVRFLADIIGSKYPPECFENIIAVEQVPVNFGAQSWGTVNEAEIAPVGVFKQPFTPEFLEQGLIVAERDKVGDDRFISHDEVAGMHRAVDRGL